MLGSPRILVGYALLGLGSGGLTYVVYGNPLVHPAPWLDLGPIGSHLYSGLLGATLGLLVVAISSRIARESEVFRGLADQLRPFALGLGGRAITLLALCSALGEEFLFRSLGGRWLGLFGQALLFGALHQVPGRARFAYILFAAVLGLALGALFQLTGSLLGPIVAHALINGLNLRFLQHHETIRNPAPLGGILGPPEPR